MTGTSKDANYPSPLAFSYLPLADSKRIDDALGSGCIAVIAYGLPDLVLPATDALVIHIPMRQLAHEPVLEIWRSDLPLSFESHGLLRCASNKELMFGLWQSRADDARPLEQQASDAYSEIMNITRASGYEYLLRTWNYVAAINEEPEGFENYRRFCLGRHDAIVELVHQMNRNLPAASAVGMDHGSLTIFFIAGRESGIQIENPRQVNAYHYPSIYGPRSPSFARAKLRRWEGGVDLYISGTASIAGHETRHAGQLLGQLDETIKNIAQLIELANNQGDLNIHSIGELSLLKVYIRHPEDVAQVREHFEKLVGGDVPVMYLRGDICRSDLLLEIEGLYST